MGVEDLTALEDQIARLARDGLSEEARADLRHMYA
jgi:DNA-binding CsgD family transcriptional regulator